jgi:tetratricopeptide (TPR) repeat protein
MVAAPRGMIWIDEHIAERAEALHEIEFIGEKSFKGFADKQATYVLYERKDEYTQFFRSEIVGREAELEQLARFIDPLQDRDFAGVLLIRGEAGIGKSRLVHEFQNSDHPTSKIALWALCQTDQLLRETFNPFRYWLQRYFGVSDTQGEARNKRSFNQRLNLLIAKTEDTALIEELDRTRSFLGALLGLYWPDSLYEESEAQGRYENTLDGLATLFLTESTIQPVIIHLEDAHWLDADSRSFLSHLVDRATNGVSQSYRIAVIATARPENESGVLGEVNPTEEISLQRLSQDEISSLAGRVLSAPAAPGLRDLLAQRADGNPFFAEQILYYLRDKGFLHLAEDGYDLGTVSQSLLSMDVRAVLVARLDQLQGEVKEVVQVASVLGREFEVPLLAQMISNGSDLSEKLSAAEHGAIWSPLSEDRYIFKHALMQEAAYNMQLQTKRQELHARAADVLEIQYAEDLSSHCGALAYHAEHSGDRQRAFPYFRLAAERAEQNYANDEAINYYTKAIDFAGFVSADARVRAELHRGRGRAHQVQGQFTQARRDYETGYQVAQDAAESQMECRALNDLGKLWASRDYNKTRQYFEQALTLARHQGDSEILGGSLNWMGNWNANNENPSEAYAYHQEALSIFEQQGNSREIANTLDLLGIAHLLGGDYNASVKYYDRAIPILRELGNPRRLLTSLLGRGIIVPLVILLAMVPPDPPPDAFQDLNEALNIAREIGSSPDEAMVDWGLGPLYTLGGDYGKGLEVSRDGIQIASRIGHREWWVGNLLARGIQYGELLAPERALEELQRGMELAEELRSQYYINHLSGAMATAHILQGDLESARRRLDSVLSEGTPMDTKGKRYCWTRRAELAFIQGDMAEALELTDRLIDSAAGMGPGKVITFLWLMKGKALKAMSKTVEAETLLQEAAENVQKTGERFLVWRIHGALGQLYLKMDRQEEAAKEMASAGELIEEIAATVPDEELKQNFRRQALKTLKNN